MMCIELCKPGKAYILSYHGTFVYPLKFNFISTPKQFVNIFQTVIIVCERFVVILYCLLLQGIWIIMKSKKIFCFVIYCLNAQLLKIYLMLLIVISKKWALIGPFVMTMYWWWKVNLGYIFWSSRSRHENNSLYKLKSLLHSSSEFSI